MKGSLINMWDNYYDEVEYKESTGENDQSGYPDYKKPRKIKCRNVSGGTTYTIEQNETSIKYTKEYQIPFMIKENDMIDGRLVLNVEASKDVFGRFHFCIARVE